MPREFTLPDLGEGIAEAQIIRVLVKEGDAIAEDQYLMEVETDKAAVEIPSPFAGVASRVHVKEGDTVNVGEVVVTFDNGDGSAPAAKKPEVAKTAAPAAPAAAPQAAAPVAASAQRTKAAAAPVVRKMAREMGIDLDAVTGTGPGGRVTKDDLTSHAAGPAAAPVAAAASAPAPMPVATKPLTEPEDLPPGTDGSDKWGHIRSVPLNQIRKTIANQMAKAAFTAVHVTHGDEADITQLDRLRRNLNEATGGDPKLTAMTFVVRAVALALKRHPAFNASFDEQGSQIIYKKYINLGIAVDSQRGLIVPVIRDVDRLSMRGIAHALRHIADQIRTNQFAIEDLRGGTFTITNVGAFGGTFNTPIINHPEVAILGLGRSRKVPCIRKGQLAEKLILPLNLSFDHRSTDGANAARFTRDIMTYLETPAMFMLD